MSVNLQAAGLWEAV
jgi:hypothetical protein